MTPPLFVPALGRSLYPGASVALDFTRNLYRSGTPVVKGSPSLLSGWTFSRASTGYAETAAGALVAFASGEIRRTDKGLLVEEARASIVLGSTFAYVSGNAPAEWTAGFNTGTSRGTATSTIGAPTAWTATVTAGTRESIHQTVTLAANSTYTFSIYVEAVSGTTGTFAYATNLPAGASTGSIADPASPGRYTFTITTVATAGTAQIRLGPGCSGADAGNCTIRYSAPNLELGAFPTSYIPTTTASATRAADAPILAISLANGGLTVISGAQNAAGTTGNGGVVVLDDNSSNNRLANYTTSATSLRVFTAVGGSGVGLVGGTTVDGAAFKQATSFNGVDRIATSGNGSAITSGTNALTPAVMVNLRPGKTSPSANELRNGYVRQIIIYPYAFTDAQLIAAST